MASHHGRVTRGVPRAGPRCRRARTRPSRAAFRRGRTRSAATSDPTPAVAVVAAHDCTAKSRYWSHASLRIERDAGRREPLAVVLDDLTLDRLPHRVGAPSCTSRRRRRASPAPGRPRPSRGNRCDRRTRRRRGSRCARRRARACPAPAPNSSMMSSARVQVELGERVERLVHLVAERVDGSLDVRDGATDAHAARRDPREITVGCEPLRLPERRVQERQLLDDVARTRRDVGVARTGEPAPRRDEILEHHHVLARRRSPRTRLPASAPGLSTRGRDRSAPP